MKNDQIWILHILIMANFFIYLGLQKIFEPGFFGE